MKSRNTPIAFIALLFPLLLMTGCTEYLPISSGALSGKATEAPAQWTDVAPALQSPCPKGRQRKGAGIRYNRS